MWSPEAFAAEETVVAIPLSPLVTEETPVSFLAVVFNGL